MQLSQLIRISMTICSLAHVEAAPVSSAVEHNQNTDNDVDTLEGASYWIKREDNDVDTLEGASYWIKREDNDVDTLEGASYWIK
ncbi:hypothetical protein F5Y16DRAFT_406500 [Xylariaceae sp. FL0255]|nr:hypothetical protein F5Y16DRAFT_406500 [Xylariaceae sp. FL0255]